MQPLTTNLQTPLRLHYSTVVLIVLLRRPTRKQFLIAGNQAIYAYAIIGEKFPACENITEKTTEIKCKLSIYYVWGILPKGVLRL